MLGGSFSHYDIEEKIGEGGMGVVYKARDLRLDRYVALKVLPSDRVSDPERKRRFVQEARAASALNHPNIVTIYDIDQADGTDFIAMEFIDGKALDRLIPRNGMPLREILVYAIQIAGALARAHGAGIIHRDIKPANIMATPDGHVKVLDFGLAKLNEQRGGDTEAPTVAMEGIEAARTEEGTIVGTAAYMSPEQAQGKSVDARGDIFSFGSVLYEMVTGRRAFREENNVSTLAAILHKEPTAVRAIAADVPRDLEKIIARCLRKDPNRRFQHMDDVKVALEELKEESESGRPEVEVTGLRARQDFQKFQWIAIALAIVVTAAGAVWWSMRKKTEAPARAHYLVRLTADAGLTTDPALSPDGKLLAYASDRGAEGNLDIWVQQVSGGEAIRLTRDPADDSEPVFSPDGSKIAFRSERDGGGVYIMSALGGEARRVVRQGRRPRFSPDGLRIAYTVGELQLAAAPKSFVISSEGGPSRQIQPDFFTVLAPTWSPDGKHLLFQGLQNANSGDYAWWLDPVEGGTAVQTSAAAVFQQRELRVPLAQVWRADDNSVVFSARLGDAVNLLATRHLAADGAGCGTAPPTHFRRRPGSATICRGRSPGFFLTLGDHKRMEPPC